MPRGTQFGQLIQMFKAEARQSSQLSVITDSLPHVKQVLRRTQNLLYAKHFWEFLSVYPTKTMVAGSRYYDPPADLNIDRVEEAVVIYNGEPIAITKGIGFGEYAQFDPVADERSSPVENWDIRWTGTATQVEVWPLPADNTAKIMWRCMRPLRPLVELDDVADLDDDLIVLFAAAEELAAQKSRDAELKLKLAQSHLISCQANAQAGSPMFQTGLGSGRGRPSRAIVRVT